MLMNYHGMTMSESRYSPQRRYQFLTICAIMASCFLYSLYISGILVTIEPFETPFPGGNFCYKQFNRDYVASMGLGRRIRKNVLEAFPKEDDATKGISVNERKKMIEDKFYHVYLDNPEAVGGAHMRWMSGVLASDAEEKMSYCDPLFDKNPGIAREAETHRDEPENEKKASDLFAQALYQSADLPSVKSLAIKFPFTNGFLSGLVFSYKIIPEMRKLAAEKGETIPVVISQCSEGEKVCTHYVPLVNSKEFLIGLPPTEEYIEKISVAAKNDSFFIVEAFKGGLRVIFPFLKPYIDTATTTTTTTNDNDAEL